MNAAYSTTPSAPPATGTFFDPDHYLLGIVQRLVATKQSATIEVPSGGKLYILPELGEYASASTLTGETLRKFCSCAGERYVVRKLMEPPHKLLAEAGQYRRNLDELMWEAALAVADGRLMKGCKSDDVVVLKFWPNLTRVSLSPNAVRIAALLTRYPTSVSLAYRLLKIPQSEMNEFYSAARCAGLAVAVNRKPELGEQQLDPHRQRTLLSMIMRRLSGPKGTQ
jgi:hypothetical protein